MSAPPPYVPGPDEAGKYPPPQQSAYPSAYPPQQPYQQPYQAQPAGGQQTTVVVSVPQTAMIAGDQPVQTTCANCHQTIVTNVVYETGGLTWLIFAILCIVGCWPCSCIPFCVDDCKDVVHTCPSCSFVLGRHKRL